MEVEIEPIQLKDFSEAMAVLGKAFATQPSSLAIYKGRTPLEIEQIMKNFFGARLKYLPAQIYVAKKDGRVVGAMRMVEWPDCHIKPIQMLRALPIVMKGRRLGEMRRWMNMRRKWARKDPKKPHWHLGSLGVIPELQNRGIGSQMMEYYCDYVDRLKMAAYHETDRQENVKFYERFGFKVIGEEIIMNFPNWYMWRSSNDEK
jgi:ribosomal protein S18 acetylase RimI-like enzyme